MELIMACFKPLSVWQDTGNTNSITFVRDTSKPQLPSKLPCGQCIGCRLDSRTDWCTRLLHESQLHVHAMFVTCTYAPEHLPEHETLVKQHPRSFIRAIRQHLSRNGLGKIRYFTAAEYGDQTKRPHYHILIFGHWFNDLKPYSGTGQHTLYMSDTLNNLWGKGSVIVGSVTPSSINYCTGYVTKKLTGDFSLQAYQRVDTETGEVVQVEPEFMTMSTRPGIGFGFYEKFTSDFYPSDSCIVAGTPRKVPKYYDRKHGEVKPEQLEQIKLSRIDSAKNFKFDNTVERLSQREQCRLARLKLFQQVQSI